MKEVRVNAYAKVNFTLDILGAEGGFHLLDSLVSTVSLYDAVTVRARTDGRVDLSVQGIGAEKFPARSNALRAAEAFFDVFGGGGADIVLDRSIPVGAGLGSSSADAAGVLSALARLNGIADADALKKIADGLGSDTGYLLTGGWARITGRGERVQPLTGMPRLHLLLLCPADGVSSAQCFARYDGLGACVPPRTDEAIARFRQEGAKGARACGNALTQAACSLCEGTRRALEAAAGLGASGFGMTGSGSACYAVFGSARACRLASDACSGAFTAFCVHTLT